METATADTAAIDDVDKPIWGARAIAVEAYGEDSIAARMRAYRLLERGKLGRKVFGRYVSSRRVIHRDLGL